MVLTLALSKRPSTSDEYRSVALGSPTLSIPEWVGKVYSRCSGPGKAENFTHGVLSEYEESRGFGLGKVMGKP